MKVANKAHSELDYLREQCEADLWTFAQVVEPHRVWGEIHEKLFKWWQHKAGENSLVLLPRDHQKSHCMAVLTSWLITRDPAISIIYVSATSTLAEKQLYDIKNIMLSKPYRRFWPDMINLDEGKRERCPC